MSVETSADEARVMVDKYDAETAAITGSLFDYIDANYGERCKDFDELCPTCKLWKLFDQFETITR